MTSPSESPKQRDPISIFLIASALALGGMYFLEGQARGADEEANRLAQEYVATAGLKCVAASAGPKGSTLSLSKCEAGVELTNIAWDKVPSEFAEIALTTDTTWAICPRGVTGAQCDGGERKAPPRKKKPAQ